jgi:hypothetical protein
MKIKLLVSLGGPDKVYSRGDEYECGAEEAARHVESGNAEYIRTAPVERAVKAPKTEKAVKGA